MTPAMGLADESNNRKSVIAPADNESTLEKIKRENYEKEIENYKNQAALSAKTTQSKNQELH